MSLKWCGGISDIPRVVRTRPPRPERTGKARDRFRRSARHHRIACQRVGLRRASKYWLLVSPLNVCDQVIRDQERSGSSGHVPERPQSGSIPAHDLETVCPLRAQDDIVPRRIVPSCSRTGGGRPRRKSSGLVATSTRIHGGTAITRRPHGSSVARKAP